ncbi:MULTISPECIES: hypothetical protein [unclassified Lysobacter]|uniref:hypothetical protein n=1 Tax=unclassified Lysobacter TaxID=2635362 RepID=UPI001BE93499|nr:MULTISPECIES: hypothetical protein [unclassified Lysobacter]MBT2746201.1 hypothetical protein [Lysobacter sp. ISL-42]MBT2750746.1 hypothetical protein [Lysobacter sp. ISL-50]MBT2776107.1 hypothetical protein [Lysobacter sp. ISL-54]MBT2784613.1 hypothetical protein [Lysobacter sp. ISL-52]
MSIDTRNERSAAMARLQTVAEILATGLIRMRRAATAAAKGPVDLDNASEERVYVTDLKPPRRDRRDIH